MSGLLPPPFESRRRPELRDELLERGRLWLSEWRPREPKADFGTALLEIAARLASEVTERLGRIPDKEFRGFLDWLGVRGQAGRAARLPVVFGLASGSDPVEAPAGAQLQASATDPPVTFETEEPLLVVPGRLAALVGVDPARDAYALPPPGVLAPEGPSSGPDEWTVKSPASAGATKVQLEPELGLDRLPTLLHERTGLQYRVTGTEGDIVTIEPPLGTVESGRAPLDEPGLEVGERLTREAAFRPFDESERNRQEHAVYLGSESILNLQAEARITIAADGPPIGESVEWAYWGKAGGGTTDGWQAMSAAVDGGRVVLRKQAGSVETHEIEGHRSRWVRGMMTPGGTDRAIGVSGLTLAVNCDKESASADCPAPAGTPPSTVELVALTNNTPLVLNNIFFPLGREPRLFDAFYLGSAEAFSKKGARVWVCFERPDAGTEALSAARVGEAGGPMLFAVGRDGYLQRLLVQADGSLQRLAPVRPPFTETGVARPPVPPATLNRRQEARLTAVRRRADTVVAVTAGREAWLWRQSQAPGASRWHRAGVVGDAGGGMFGSEGPPSVVVLRDGDGLRLVGLRGGRLHGAWLAPGWEDAGVPRWRPLAPPGGTTPTWRRIVPILGESDRDEGPDVRHGWLAIDDDGDLVVRSGGAWAVAELGLIPAVAPLGIRRTDGRVLVVAQRTGGLCAWSVKLKSGTFELIADAPGVSVHGSLDWAVVGGDIAVAFVTEEAEPRLGTWLPLSASPQLSSLDGLAGAPTILGEHVVVPGTGADHKVIAFPPAGPDPTPILLAVTAAPRASLGTGSSGDPKLSWEYWDGSSWWRIEDLNDLTEALTRSGTVSFCVPSNIEPTDVAGRRDHWIRARLIGGDYGRASVIVTSTTTGGVVEQTTETSLANVNPPQYADVELRYSLCCPAHPDRVLTRDGGILRDQTDANRTPGATVELFMPLAEALEKATGEASSTSAPTVPASARAVFVGFDAELRGEPIGLLFLVEEGGHEDAHPLQVEALRHGRFESVIVEDGTRGLNESGAVTLILSEPPQATELFGASRYWLRLRPRPGFDAERWRPRIREAYVNGTFARAAETQRMEVLGSSDGSPGQRVYLARPPVLDDSLELRVWEPLGEEEIAELGGPGMVPPRLGNREGPWVLWREVVDPADEGEGERVYALDDETGEIRFGDGLHGRIPPIRQDSILAVRYQRGGGRAANGVAAWSPLNLMTPIQGVDRVAAPEGAAGGSDPQGAEAMLRFASANLLMRERALTQRDLESLALQFSPDVAQAKARPGKRGVGLVVVMGGQNPTPSSAVRRELGRHLALRASPDLAEGDGLVITGPEVVATRVDLRVTVDAIEHSGSVAREAASRVAGLLDPATGGLDGWGWPLGQAPSGTEIAASLDGMGHVEGVERIAVLKVRADGATGPMPVALEPTQLVSLVPDGVSVEVALAGVEALP